MTLSHLINIARNKTNFTTIEDYSVFCEKYLTFIFDSLQAVIVSKNETQYRFFQYKKDGNYNITRPINNNLMISINDFSDLKKTFIYAIQHIKDIKKENENELLFLALNKNKTGIIEVSKSHDYSGLKNNPIENAEEVLYDAVVKMSLKD